MNSGMASNPILGYSESESKRKQLKDEYADYVKKGLQEDKASKRSKSRRQYENRSVLDYNTDANRNDYRQKQRYQQSYFKFSNEKERDHSVLSNKRGYSNKKQDAGSDFSSPYKSKRANAKIDQYGYYNEELSQNPSPTKTVISILPGDQESANEKDRKK